MQKHHSLLANFHLLPSKLTMTNYSRSNPVLPTTSQNANAVNPSVILPFAAICNFEVPTTELDPDFVPSVWFCSREPDRFLAHQQKQTTSNGVTTTTAPSADTGRYVEVRVK